MASKDIGLGWDERHFATEPPTMSHHTTESSEVQHRRKAMPLAKLFPHLRNLGLVSLALSILKSIPLRHQLCVFGLYIQPVQDCCEQPYACTAEKRSGVLFNDSQ